MIRTDSVERSGRAANHVFEKRELTPDEKQMNLVLHFNPQPAAEMLIVCLWSHWTHKTDPDLYSFAAVTDEPPPEVAATGHNRCIIRRISGSG